MKTHTAEDAEPNHFEEISALSAFSVVKKAFRL
jgi:hypothetical protein